MTWVHLRLLVRLVGTDAGLKGAAEPPHSIGEHGD